MSEASGDAVPGCPLCGGNGSEIVWADSLCRVIEVDDPDYPGFYRVVLQRHCAEMTDLQPSERASLMSVVWEVESVLREQLRPDKINLASLGNVVPHLHWHVIPRWRDDVHFPNPIWGNAQRARPPREVDRGQLRSAIRERLAAGVRP